MRGSSMLWMTVALGIATVALLLLSSIGLGASVGPNYRNVSSDTTVNITNSAPEIVNITVDPQSITLNAGSSTRVYVNTTIRDFDGQNDIDTVQGTFFDQSVSVSNDSDDNNFHYSDNDCNKTNGDGDVANYSCAFDLEYYANNGTWEGNVTVNDTQNFNDSENETGDVQELRALNVTQLLDYGNLQVGEANTNPVTANVTNFGNVDINTSVYGYGNETNDGLAMVCDERNITIGYERFSENSSKTWADMNNLTTDPQDIPGFSVLQRTNDTAITDSRNSTYWKLKVPVDENPGGRCNGTVVFQAEFT